MTIVSIFYILIQVVSIGVLGSHLAAATTPVQAAMTEFMGNGGLIIVAAGELISIGGIKHCFVIYHPTLGSCLSGRRLVTALHEKTGPK